MNRERKVFCRVSIGELVDKITILRLKTQNISDPEKVLLAQKEKEALEQSLSELNLEGIEHWIEKLMDVNGQLWQIEDQIREKEAQKSFDKEFVELARSVYLTNDKRFALKSQINQDFGSEMSEVKSYQKY